MIKKIVLSTGTSLQPHSCKATSLVDKMDYQKRYFDYKKLTTTFNKKVALETRIRHAHDDHATDKYQRKKDFKNRQQ